MSSRIKLADVARLAGCSLGQASRAVNGLGLVSPDTRERVLKIARQLNYRNTAKNHRPQIAVCHRGDFGAYESAMLRAVFAEAKKRSWSVMTLQAGEEQQIRDFFFDGVIIIGYHDERTARHWYQKNQTPLVIINGYGSVLEQVCTVDPDRNDENAQVLSLFKKYGHQRIARLQKTLDLDSVIRNRGEEEFMSCAANLNLGSFVRNVIFDDPAELEPLLGSLYREGFTAFFVVHQAMAIPAFTALQKLQIRCPQEVSLITYEVENVSGILSPSLSTLDFDYPALAAAAFKILGARIKGHEQPFLAAVNVPNKLYLRGSVGPASGI